MEVKLLHMSNPYLVVLATRTCHNSFNRMDSTPERLGEKDRQLLQSLLKLKHESVFEHLYFTFQIIGVSRLLLQELTRHRIASYSVKSTRFTLAKAIAEINSINDVEEYIVIPNHFTETQKNLLKWHVFNLISEMKNLHKLGMKQDDLKYFLPECWKTELIMSINARSLKNFFNLRMAPAAHWEIRELAYKMYEVIPDEVKFIFDSEV